MSLFTNRDGRWAASWSASGLFVTSILLFGFGYNVPAAQLLLG